MLCFWNAILILNIGPFVFGNLEKVTFLNDDLSPADSVYHVESKPSSHENDFRRLLQNVFPPQSVLFSPYGQRTIIAFKFPKFPRSQRWNPNPAQQSQASGSQSQYTPQGQIPPYTPNSEYDNHPPRNDDNAVIISQHFQYRENVRYNQRFENSSTQSPPQPSNELAVDLAKSIAHRHGKYEYGGKSKFLSSSFVIIALESRSRTKPTSGQYGIPGGDSWTNGTIVFPSPKNPLLILTSIPFTLIDNSDVGHVIDLTVAESQWLTPQAISEMKVFLNLLNKIHAQKHKEGRKSINDLVEFERKLTRPRLTVPQGVDPLPEDDPINIERDTQARLNNWLYTSTVGFRTISPSLENPLQFGKYFVDPALHPFPPHY